MKKLIRDRVTTTDENGNRIPVFAADVRGLWQKRRFWIQWGMILLYLTVPWMTVNGHPLLLLDIAHRRFSILGQLFFAHEAPTLVFFTLSFFFFIALVTTILGRVWCGWTCPQTVFIDRVFRKIETWIEGDHLKQRRLYQAPWSAHKVFLRTLKWTSFTAVTLILTHSFMAYFVGSDSILAMMTQSPSQNPVAFTMILLMSAIILFDFGMFREQFCLAFCPYGRFQSVVQDEQSTIVGYDYNSSDCVECNKCVAVCPTGIDIRNGLQIECIGCTACIDACDGVMEKVKRPQGLIRYTSLTELKGGVSRILRGRTLIYGVLFLVTLSALLYRTQTRKDVQFEVVRGIGTPYQQVEQGQEKWIINQFNLHFYNMSWNQAGYQFALDSESKIELVTANATLSANSGENQHQSFFIKAPLSLFEQQSTVKVRLRLTPIDSSEAHNKETYYQEIQLIGPSRLI